MSDDFGLFKTDENAGEPPDGQHAAQLVRAAILDTKNGKRIKIEWQTVDLACWWESWHGVSGGSKPHTRALLKAIGISLDDIGSWDQLADMLVDVEDRVFDVKVARNGDWLNTTVIGRSQGVQTDLPVDTNGLPDASPPAAAARATAGMFDDDDDAPPF